MKSLYEETRGTYHQEGDYLLPDLVAPESIPIGIWGQRRRRYLREHHNGIYTGMLLVGTLHCKKDAAIMEIGHPFHIIVETEKYSQFHFLNSADSENSIL